MKDALQQNGHSLIRNLFQSEEIEACTQNILAYADLFRRKLRSAPESGDQKITSVDDLSDYLEWLDHYNSDYLFEFVSTVSQLPALRRLTVLPQVLATAADFLDRPENELVVGQGSFLVNTPGSSRLIYDWHNAKNEYPKRNNHINFWVPLIVNKTATNGTLHVANGSHHRDYPFLEYRGPSSSMNTGALTQNRVPDEYVHQFETQALVCPLGDAGAMLPRTLHTGSLNESNRCSYVMVFKVWANHEDWTLSSQLAVKYNSGDKGAGADVRVV